MAAPEPEERCPRCETPYNPGQEYCLECGSRLPARGGMAARLGTVWRRRLGWYPGDWIWPSQDDDTIKEPLLDVSTF